MLPLISPLILLFATLGSYLYYRFWIRNLTYQRFIHGATPFYELYDQVESVTPVQVKRTAIDYQQILDYAMTQESVLVKAENLVEPSTYLVNKWVRYNKVLIVLHTITVVGLMILSVINKDPLLIPGYISSMSAVALLHHLNYKISNQLYIDYAQRLYEFQNPGFKVKSPRFKNKLSLKGGTKEQQVYFQRNKLKLTDKYKDHKRPILGYRSDI